MSGRRTEAEEVFFSEGLFSTSERLLIRSAGRELVERQITISCCESCTGGLFAAALTGVPGISRVFDRGLVTYTERAKIEELGVKKETLEAHTVYSAEVAREMAEGLYRKTGSDICVSVTGIAGPDGALPGKPVGTVYIGCCHCGKIRIEKLETGSRSRSRNRHDAVLAMLRLVMNTLKEE
ncbi:hypothetical protein BHK98_01615 [Hornefia porci]|uniref:CinA C-terminal domain-containing protein n=1 Tax=Hornefia porci TaxID=2652292 RepID=A0A1Q9JFL1_9FIRM|nr:CinA family protein [Hornefia porci]OLR54891.1 hypothetical protein BHK98_01615 [Hornefia porci]